MKVTYAGPLDEKKVIAADLGGRFSVITAAVAAKVNRENIGPNTFDHRTMLAQPLKIGLARYFGYPDAITDGGLFGGYRVINESRIYHEPFSASATDRGVTGRPVVQARARVSLIETNGLKLNISRLCIGKSTDGGATWTPLTTTSRPTGQSCGYAYRVFDTPLQNNYWSGVVNYYPFNANFDRGVELVASFGGDVSNSAALLTDLYCVMVNDFTNLNRYLFGSIFLNAREKVF